MKLAPLSLGEGLGERILRHRINTFKIQNSAFKITMQISLTLG
jgi:hypothetical protein